MPSRRSIAIVSVTALVVTAGVAGGAYYLLHTRGTPEGVAERFTRAWEQGDLNAMGTELATRQAAFTTTYQTMNRALGVESVSVKLDPAKEPDGDRARVTFTATLKLKNAGDWSYRGGVDLVVRDRHWKVAWTPAAAHPDLADGRGLALKPVWPARAAITAASGDRVDGGDAGGSVQQLVGFLDKATDKDVKRLGSAYKAGDAVGRGGLQETFQTQLAGTPATEIRLVGADGKPVRTLHKAEGEKGRPVETTLDLRVQRAAADAVRDLKKTASLVAVRPSTGEVLAVVNNLGGFNRALNGAYPPGSTFKSVTAAGLLAEGVSPGDRVECPRFATLGGMRFRNSEYADHGSLSFSDAFAYSCNTTIAPMTAERLGADKLVDTAEWFGFNEPLNIGVPAAKASFPKARSETELAAESFGQGKITASPLMMATVAAAIADGSWRPPTLVASIKQKTRPKALPDGVAASLRDMMKAVVTKGTAKSAGLPSGTRGKTGTAEYDTPEGKTATHAWFIGFRGDLAFSVLVEGGEAGGKVAAPVAADFLRGL
ncbi:NTF2-like N-terminal transpeptidase domain-containing protein [Sinosporangium album]|uniref:NTF2-like N-terminal transpeptidase domain-containing protein n=1 Tax=Sinosporangium album TaxID=504805 RepID=A0A1G7WR39_9ACTN|nr:penicillin-binding transpeptidase domain-containing protein [Sinosporangium album]SDG73700.1 NTF2-like N-terminal transpeptidase domain-containing protein [Sinosporangium album]